MSLNLTLSKTKTAMDLVEEEYTLTRKRSIDAQHEVGRAEYQLDLMDEELDKAILKFDKTRFEYGWTSIDGIKTQLMLNFVEENQIKAEEKVIENKSKAKLANTLFKEASQRYKTQQKLFKFMEKLCEVPNWISINETWHVKSLKSGETVRSKMVVQKLTQLPDAIIIYIGEFFKPLLKKWEQDIRHVKIVELLWEKIDNPDTSTMCGKCRIHGVLNFLERPCYHLHCNVEKNKFIRDGYKLIKHHLL
jgi:hypothetical protein